MCFYFAAELQRSDPTYNFHVWGDSAGESMLGNHSFWCLTTTLQASEVAERRRQSVIEKINSEAKMMAKIEFVTNTLSIVMGLGQAAAQVSRTRSSGDGFRALISLY